MEQEKKKNPLAVMHSLLNRLHKRLLAPGGLNLYATPKARTIQPKRNQDRHEEEHTWPPLHTSSGHHPRSEEPG
ncbi:uncharacterized protein SETTUDRAFT_164328 [Exserohilum turcica Et28A]|uniref:Uncharacterized protein n=1 Tax=Exserohilum turcicum (strain 28A) TaxID=671987 RepID=R0K342_EXST2|nr:uncharacterized protein SETTUDRAFT_164328 [Exserohilum turcica Et28A]EOA84014.1 hypothetical protein SETTUDRAFT_164328 [Exserohilum turcica Et28A]